MKGERDVTSYRRRLLIKRLAFAGGLPGLYAVSASRAGLAGAEAESFAATDVAALMESAMEMKRIAVDTGDQPYGAIVTKGGEIVGEGPSRVVVNQDPTAHAEIEAIRDAARRLGTRDLSGCVLYGTSRPCRMCETAAYWANVSRFVFGGGLVDGGAPTYSSC